MKIRNIFGVAALLGAAVAMPNVMTAATCASLTNTYAALQAAGTCTIADLTFGGFTFQGNPNTITATQMTFQVLNGVSGAPFNDPTGQLLWGFEFNPALTVSGANQFADILIGYYVAAPVDEIASLHLAMTGSGTGSGIASVTEGDCGFSGTPYQNAPGMPQGPCTPFNPQLIVVQPSSSSAKDYSNIGPFGAFAVSKDINVSTGASGGVATISGVLDAFDKSVIPEPATVSYLLIGCLALFGAARRRKQVQ